MAEIVAFYTRLLAVLGTGDTFYDGIWSSVAPQPAWPGNPTWNDFISCTWRGRDGSQYVVAVNYSDHQAQCRLPLPFDDIAGKRLRLVDVMGREEYVRDGSELVSPGLYLDLGPWRPNVFRLDSAAAS